MLGLFCLGTLLGRGSSSINALFFAASVMVLITPSWWQTLLALLCSGLWHHHSGASEQLSESPLASILVVFGYYGAHLYLFFRRFLSPFTFANLILIPLVTAFIMPLAWFGIIIGSYWTAPLEWAAEACLFFLASHCEQLNILGCESWFRHLCLVLGDDLLFGAMGLAHSSSLLFDSVHVRHLFGLHLTPTVHVLSVGQGDATLISSK